MSAVPKLELISSNSHSSSGEINYLGLSQIYQLSQLTKSSLSSKIYAVTGIQLDQKKLIVSFLFTLIKDFSLAYTVRASLKLIPKLLKMIQLLK